MRGAFLIWKKEFLELSKDRRTVFFTFVMPLIIYPLIFTMMTKLGENDSAKREAKPSRIHLVDPAGVLAPALRADARTFALVDGPAGGAPQLRQAIRDQKLEMEVQVDPRAAESLERATAFPVKAVYDSSDDSSRLALKRVKKALQALDTQWVQARLKTLGASAELAVPSHLEEVDAGDKALEAGKFLGSLLPYVLMMMMFAGGMQHGIYATAGEKERGTLLSLLSTSIPRSQIIIGKLLYVFSIGLITALISLLSIGLSITRIVATHGGTGAGPSGMEALGNPVTLILTFLLMVPLGLFFANFIILGGIQARNTVEAGTALMPGMLVVVVLGVFSMAPGIEKMAFLPYTPVLNVSLAIRKLFSQQGNQTEYLIAFAMTVGLAALMTWLSTRMLNRESSIFKV
jgi:sodium transport system permease protein